ncbi:MAG: tetratricopeptide repeat protein [Deltaproteobacteria bacterium]|nr:tetratricopeptide repeat protein [Deltaproteobacteria bacterium]
MKLRALLFVIGWGCASLSAPSWTSTALAQEVAERSDVERDAEARRLFEAGRTAFESSLYEVALSCFRRAFDLSGRTALLYNIGIVAQRLGRVDEALAAFERFSREAPDDPERADVQARIEVLRDVRPRAAPAEVQPPPRARDEGARGRPAAPRRTRPRAARRAEVDSVREPERDGGAGAAPWVTAALGALVATSGVVLVVAATDDASVVEEAASGTRWGDVSDRADRAPGLFVAGEIAVVVGIAAIGAGLGWWALGRREETGAAPTMRVGATGIQGTF